MESLALVERWVEAVNAADIPAAVSLSAQEIEMAGPRGTTHGQRQLRDWVERAGLRMTTTAAFVREDRVVLLQRAEWRDAKGTPIAEAIIASRFVVAGGRVVSVTRYDQLDAALRDAQLGDQDRVERA